MDRNLNEVAKSHPKCVFVSLNDKKVILFNLGSFFWKKIKDLIFTHSLLFNKKVLINRLLGFEGLSGDEFKTIELTRKFILILKISLKKWLFQK